MDYRELLKKYVQLIVEQEGVIYYLAMERAGFTTEEMAEIERLASE